MRFLEWQFLLLCCGDGIWVYHKHFTSLDCVVVYAELNFSAQVLFCQAKKYWYVVNACKCILLEFGVESVGSMCASMNKISAITNEIMKQENPHGFDRTLLSQWPWPVHTPFSACLLICKVKLLHTGAFGRIFFLIIRYLKDQNCY